MIESYEARFLKVLLFSTFVLAMVGATPSSEGDLLVPSIIVGLIGFLLVSWHMPRTASASFIFLLSSIAYILFTSFIVAEDLSLLLRNGAFLIVVPIYLWIFFGKRFCGVFRFQLKWVLFLIFSLLIYRFFILEGLTWESGRLLLDDFNIADTAILSFLAVSIVYGGRLGMIYAISLILIVAGFGIRLNALLGLIILVHFLTMRYGIASILLLSLSLLSYLFLSLSVNEFFIFEKMAQYGASYKTEEFLTLARQFSVDVLVFPRGLNYVFNLGVFDGGVYFSHWLLFYLTFVAGFVGIALFIFIVFFVGAGIFLGFRFGSSSRLFLLMGYVSIAALPSISFQATYKSLTFGGIIVAIVAFVLLSRRLRRGALNAAR